MGRRKRGGGRIDAALDNLTQYGFAKPKIRKIINDLLQLYGREGWVFLEEGSYRVVLEKLLEQQAQEDQKQEAAAAEVASPQNGMEASRVHGEEPNESQSSLELQASPNSSPLPPAKGPPREESETESEPEDGEILSDVPKKDIPNPVETLASKRKRPSRWDVQPNKW